MSPAPPPLPPKASWVRRAWPLACWFLLPVLLCPGVGVYLLTFRGLWSWQSKVRANHYLDELLARVEPERRRYFGERPLPSSRDRLGSMPEKIPYMLFGIWASVFEGVGPKFVQAASITDLTRLACALERFRLARGLYPERLAELAPEFIAPLPTEIVNGEPYRYRRTEDGRFLLYSVGIDLRDDGGMFDPALKAKQKDWFHPPPPPNP